MIAASRRKEFDIILVHKFDRFARNDYDFVVYDKELEDLNIVVERLSEPGDASTPATRAEGSESVCNGYYFRFNGGPFWTRIIVAPRAGAWIEIPEQSLQ